MQQGFIKWYKSQLGYGFIVDENNTNYFAHYSDFNDKSATKSTNKLDGRAVTFDVIKSGDKKQAVNITLV